MISCITFSVNESKHKKLEKFTALSGAEFVLLSSKKGKLVTGSILLFSSKLFNVFLSCSLFEVKMMVLLTIFVGRKLFLLVF